VTPLALLISMPLAGAVLIGIIAGAIVAVAIGRFLGSRNIVLIIIPIVWLSSYLY